MIYFVSGINDRQQAQIAQEAGCWPLVDPIDLRHVDGKWPDSQIALDSGAYRNFKDDINPTEDLVKVHRTTYEKRQFAFKMALDTIDNPEQTINHYRKYYVDTDFTPVWQWGATRQYLDYYLNVAPTVTLPDGTRTQLVAIGGLVHVLRGGHRVEDPKEKKRLNKLRDEAIDGLVAICSEFPANFHILGLNSLKALDALRYLAPSADSSKANDGGRYKYAFIVNTRTGKLSQVPAARLGEPYASMSRNQRIAHNMRELMMYAKGVDE